MGDSTVAKHPVARLAIVATLAILSAAACSGVPGSVSVDDGGSSTDSPEEVANTEPAADDAGASQRTDATAPW